jgi:hypothetical protein
MPGLFFFLIRPVTAILLTSVTARPSTRQLGDGTGDHTEPTDQLPDVLSTPDISTSSFLREVAMIDTTFPLLSAAVAERPRDTVNSINDQVMVLVVALAAVTICFISFFIGNLLCLVSMTDCYNCECVCLRACVCVCVNACYRSCASSSKLWSVWMIFNLLLYRVKSIFGPNFTLLKTLPSNCQLFVFAVYEMANRSERNMNVAVMCVDCL